MSGVTCGRPSARTVVSQYSSASPSTRTTSSQAAGPAAGSLKRVSRAASGVVMGMETAGTPGSHRSVRAQRTQSRSSRVMPRTWCWTLPTRAETSWIERRFVSGTARARSVTRRSIAAHRAGRAGAACGACAVHRPRQRAAAEVAGVVRAAEVDLDEVGRAREVRVPAVEPDLHARGRVVDGAEVAPLRQHACRGAVAEPAQHALTYRPTSPWKPGTATSTRSPAVPDAATSARARPCRAPTTCGPDRRPRCRGSRARDRGSRRGAPGTSPSASLAAALEVDDAPTVDREVQRAGARTSSNGGRLTLRNM